MGSEMCRWNRWWMDRITWPCWLRGAMVRGWDGHCWAPGLVGTPEGGVMCTDCRRVEATERMEAKLEFERTRAMAKETFLDG